MANQQDSPEFDRTDEQPKSAYLSKKDLKIFAVAFLLLMVALLPVYFMLKKRAEAFICKKNFAGIAAAMSLYAADNNDRLPPVYVVADGQAPFMENGRVVSWATLIEGHMSEDATFRCPTADETENTACDAARKDGKNSQLSYGMYAPYGGVAISSIQSPETAILVAETSNRGAQNTFDPYPLLDSKGVKSPFDSFAIHWSSGNDLPNKTTASVTRLAFPGTQDGHFAKDGATRHPDGNLFLTIAGRVRALDPTTARVDQSRTSLLKGYWSVPDSFLDTPTR